jgi:HPt (histidine-containing phosphotransfer) domain-containing protein
MAGRDLTGAMDFHHLQSYAAGDEALIDEVLDLFRQQAALWLPRFDPAGPDPAWRDAAHSLKGSALGVGAFALAKACEAAEGALHQPPGVKAALLDRLGEALDLALADIAAYGRVRADGR